MKNFRFLTCAALGALFLGTACTPTHSVRGNLVQDYQLAEIKAGQDTRSDILKKLGSPTTKAPFNDDIWYYIGQEMDKKGIMDPEVVAERIIVVSFTQDGVVKRIEDVKANRVNVPYEDRVTPTTGNEFTVLQQLLGNLGKFNTEQLEEQ